MLSKLLKLEFNKQRVRKSFFDKKNFIQILIFISFTIVAAVFFYLAINSVTKNFIRLKLAKEYLKITYEILILYVFFSQVIYIMQNIYLDKNRDIYLRLPIKKTDVLFAKTIYLFLKEFLILVVLQLFLVLPLLINGIFNHLFYIKILLLNFVVIMLPFILSTLISMVSYIFLLFIKKRGNLILLLLIITLVGLGFYAYILFISKLSIILTNTGGYISETNLRNIIDATNKLMPASQIINLLYIKSFLKFIGIFLLIILLSIIILTLSMVGIYYFVNKFKYDLENSTKVFRENKNISLQFNSLIKKEILTITRNINNSFQVICLNLLMPLFVLETTKLSSIAAKSIVGDKIILGVSLITTLLFIVLSVSYMSNVITNDKKAIYIYRIIPIKYLKVLLAKILFPLLLTILMIIISNIFLFSFKYINFKEFILLFIVELLFLLSYIVISVRSDFRLSLDKELMISNISNISNIMYGIFVSVFFGMLLIFLPFFEKKISNLYMWLIVIGLSMSNLIFSYLLFLFDLRKEKLV